MEIKITKNERMVLDVLKSRKDSMSVEEISSCIDKDYKSESSKRVCISISLKTLKMKDLVYIIREELRGNLTKKFWRPK